MVDWIQRHAHAVATAALALVCALFGLALLDPASATGSAVVRASYDGYYSMLGLSSGAATPTNVAIVYLDLDSHLREKQDPTRPWPRALHARLVRRLTAAGARAVVFDVVFDAPSPNDAVDVDFAVAMRAHGRVILGEELGVSTQAGETGAWGRTLQLAVPTPPLREAAAAVGLSELRVDTDFVPRRHFYGDEVNGKLEPSLAWATAQALGVGGPPRLPDPTEQRWFRYYGPPFSLPHRSFSQVLAEDSGPDAIFRDRIVFVGARPMAGLFAERRDEFRSPFHTWRERDRFHPGVEIHATQTLNLLLGDSLRRVSPAQEIALVVLAGLLLGGGLVRLRPAPAAAAGALAAVGIVTGAVGGIERTGTWFPWLVPLLQVPVAVGGTVLFRSVEWYRARRRLEAANRVAQTRIREQAALIEKAHDAILVQDLDGGFTYANSSAVRLFGWNLEELQGGAGGPLLADTPACEARAGALARGDWSGELRQRTRAGRDLVLDSRWTLLRDEHESPRGLLVICSDVTAQRQLEAESLRMQRMDAIGALASGMAHDLNNALAPILIGTQLLRRDAPNEDARRILGLMESSTRRGADMVRQVMLFARGRQGEFESLDPRILVTEMQKLARDTFPPSLTTTTHFADDVWAVRANPTQLHQVLLNLCVNARDAMPDGGSLSLEVANIELSAADAEAIPQGRPGAFVVIAVTDTGTGIAPELLPRLFEAFFTTKPEGKGTGLGLATSARIVKAHGGFVRVTSVVGDGTSFEVYLPRFVEDGAIQKSAAGAAIPSGQGEWVLLADDDEAVRELVRRGLEEHGYRVLTAGNGAEAVSIYKRASEPIALFVTDQAMPILAGIQAAEILRAIARNLPVLVLSAENPVPSQAGAQAGSDFLWLPKPIELGPLLEAVAQALHATRGGSQDE